MMPFSRATSTARTRFGDAPLVESTTSTSAGVADALDLASEDLFVAVVVGHAQSASTCRRGGRLPEGRWRSRAGWSRPMNSLVRCCASAAEPPFPAARSLPPAQDRSCDRCRTGPKSVLELHRCGRALRAARCAWSSNALMTAPLGRRRLGSGPLPRPPRRDRPSARARDRRRRRALGVAPFGASPSPAISSAGASRSASPT